jgi:AraC family transcriptional regulator
MSMRSVSLLKGGELKIEETEFGISNKHYSLERGSREIKAYYNKQEIAKHRLTPVNEIIDAYHVTVSFNEYRSINTFLDGKELGPKSCRSGTTHIYDFNEKWEVEVDAAHENIGLLVPFWKLAELQYEYKSPGLREFGPNLSIERDEVMLALANALLPAMKKPEQASALFLDHVFSAMAVHLAHSCRFSAFGGPALRKGLLPWQMRRVTEMLMDNLAADISLQELADLCGLSATYFARAFKLATGMAPHSWLMQQRIEKSKLEMLRTEAPLSAIALACGFADQSHFTRVFTKRTGISPGIWRRMHKFTLIPGSLHE